MRRREFLTAAAACSAAARFALAPRGAAAQGGAAPRLGRLAAFDGNVRPFVAGMTLDEKLGQMTQAELTGLADEADVERYFLGSVLSGGDADGFGQSYGRPEGSR
jgi:beta-glucosidase